MKEFLDAFKHLEKLCNEIYGEQHGVTLYINEMEQRTGFGTHGIPGWDRDLEYLKYVRHVRNSLVHESDYEYDYSATDIKFMKDFYQRIMNQEDPLSLLRKQYQGVGKKRKQPATVSVKSSDNYKPTVRADYTSNVKNRKPVQSSRDVNRRYNNDDEERVNPVLIILIVLFIIAAFLFLIWLSL